MSTQQPVAVHLYFDTDSPPPAVARAVMSAVVESVPDQLESISWGHVDLEDSEDE